MTADDAGVVADVDRSNNEATFALDLPVAPCAGDCNGDGTVTVSELLTMVDVALGNANIDGCFAGDANHDGQITVDEIHTAVNHALEGCG
ncbi:MAG: hypothetical protein ABSA52_01635 [Candidatus Binatia bacterium]